MFTIKFTSTFKKDYKLIKRQGKYAQHKKAPRVIRGARQTDRLISFTRSNSRRLQK